jgi:UDP-galactopyranose mutase
MSRYDYLIVGSGLFGATFANLAKDAGKSCLILEKRPHVAGNCYTDKIQNINVHVYGPHIFHTSNKDIWNYVNKFATFNNYVNRPKVKYNNKVYSFPINLFTLYQLWGCTNPSEAQLKLNQVKVKIENPQNLEEWVLSQVGEEIYEIFIKGYTAKQWGKDPKDLPASIIKRLPFRMSFDDNYYSDTYQGVPIGGYTPMVKNMLGDTPIEFGIDFLKDIDYWSSKANKVIYTGAIDELFDYNQGELEYRSLRFDMSEVYVEDYQGNAIVNYTDLNVPFTRIIEHKHFEQTKSKTTIITREYPQAWDKSKEKCYPINNERNTALYQRYKSECDIVFPNMILGGRLACYQYLDMHQVIAQAMHKFPQTL